MSNHTLSTKINAILPQTQCQLCEYPSCNDYANAIANSETTIDKCHPGGVEVLKKISEVTDIPHKDLIPKVIKQHKKPSYVTIDEETCIGCTKCIQACPVDAIIGTAKKMHTVIISECSGCDLCIPVCPVDCIIVKPREYEPDKNHLKDRYDTRNKRLEDINIAKLEKHKSNKLNNTSGDNSKTIAARKSAILDVLARIKK